ncbi:MAG: DUF1836 domain-containing protein [Clostridia bacterium]|nr:DUF1836 domain-containing protein [Clostridia bacterium]MBQ9919827.1 DUF1836 domain-containing protein [Clostridia bacterium]
MNFDDELLLEQKYALICEKLASHKLPRWESFPDIELYMDQVVAVMEKALSLYNKVGEEESKLITPSIINNYVKLKVIPAPNKKKYSREHLAYLVMICILKQTLAISSIVKIIESNLESKTISELYNEFCSIYENVIPFANMGEAFFDEDDVNVFDNRDCENDVNGFILKSAILSTAGKFVCEEMLSAVSRESLSK